MASLLDQIDPLATRVSLLDRLSQGEQVTQQERDALDQASSNSMGELEKGLRRSGYNLTASTEAFVGQMAEPFAPEFARRRFAGANETLRSMPTSLTPAVSSFAEAQRTGDYLPYAAGALGEGLGSTIPTVIAGLLTRGATLRAAPAVQNAASFVAGAGTMLPQEGGETALQLQNSPQALANTTPAERAALTLGRGTVGAVAETLVPEMLLTRPLAGAARAIEPGLRSAAGNFGRKAVAGGLGEAGTEAAQELVGQYAQNLAVPGTGYDLERVKEAAIAGALPGTVIGGTGAMVQAARSNLGAGIQKSTEASNKLLNTAVEQLDSALRNPEEFGYTAGNATLGALAEASARVKEFGPAAAEGMDMVAAMRQQFDRAVVGRLTPENRRKYVDLTQNFRLLQPTEYERLRDALALGDADGINEAVGDVAFQLRERVPRETLDGLKNITDWGKRFGQGVTTAAREGRKAAQGYIRDDIVRFRAFLNEAYPDVLRTMDSTDASDQLSRLLMTYRDNAQLLNTSLRPKDQQAVEYFEKVTGVPLPEVLVRARKWRTDNPTRREITDAYAESTGTSNFAKVAGTVEQQLTDELRDQYEAEDVEIGPGATGADDDTSTSTGLAEDREIGTLGEEWLRQNPSFRRDDGELMNEEDTRRTPFNSLDVVRRTIAKKILRRNGTVKDPDMTKEIPAVLTSNELTPEQIGRLIGDRIGVPPAAQGEKWGSQYGPLSDEELTSRITPEGYRMNFNAPDIAAQAGTPQERGGSKENFEGFLPDFDGSNRDLQVQGHRLLSAVASINDTGIDIPRSELPEELRAEAGLEGDGPDVHIDVAMDPNKLHDDLVIQLGGKKLTIGDLNGANRATRSLKWQHELVQGLLEGTSDASSEVQKNLVQGVTQEGTSAQLDELVQAGGRGAKTAAAVQKGLLSFAHREEKTKGKKAINVYRLAEAVDEGRVDKEVLHALLDNYAPKYLENLASRLGDSALAQRNRRNRQRLYSALVDKAVTPEQVRYAAYILRDAYSDEERQAYDEGDDDNHDIDPDTLEMENQMRAWARRLDLEFTSTTDLAETLRHFEENENGLIAYELAQAGFEQEPGAEEPTADDWYEVWRKTDEGRFTSHSQRNMHKQKDPQHLPPRKRGDVERVAAARETEADRTESARLDAIKAEFLAFSERGHIDDFNKRSIKAAVARAKVMSLIDGTNVAPKEATFAKFRDAVYAALDVPRGTPHEMNQAVTDALTDDDARALREDNEYMKEEMEREAQAEQRANDAETNVLDIGADARQAAANRHLENRLLAPLNKAMAATNSVMAVRRLKNGLTRAVAISDAPFDQAILDEAIQAGDITAHNVEVTQPRGAAEAATVLVKRDSLTDHFFRSLNTNGVIRIAASKLDKLEQLKESVVQKAASQEAEAAPVAPIQETPPAKPKPTREELRAKNAELRERLRAETAPKALNAVQRGVITKAITRLKTVPELDELQAGLPALTEGDAAFVNGLIDQQRAALAEAPTEKLTKAQVAIREQKAKIAAQRAAAERPAPQTPFAKRVTIVHSGGAAGADLLWQRMAEEAGVPVQAHSFAGHAKDNAARVEHSREELLQADDALRQANKTLNRRYPPGSAFVRHLLQRNYFQVKDADMVLAVSRIDNNGQVEGGTAWATQMGADMGKSVYVFDQYTRRWHKWDTTAGEYVLSEAPVAQGAIAGIGTRELAASGAQAIRDIVGGKATEALRVLEGRREGESNVDYVRRMKLQQTQPPKRSTHIEPQKPAPKKQALVQKPANERNSPPAPPGETKPLSAYERRLVSGAEFSKKTLPAQIVNNWAKKYLGGADVRVVEYDPRDPEVQEYFGGADKMPRGRAISANYFAPNTPAMILIQRSTSKQAGTRYGRMHALAHEFGHIIDYIALRNAPEEVKALIDQAYKRIVTDAVADGRTDEAMFNAGTVLRFIYDADKNSVLTGDDPVIQNHQRLAEGMVARKERGDQDMLLSKEEFFAEQFAKYAMNDPNIFAGESKTVRAYLDKVLAQVKKFYREVILQLDKTAPEFDAFMKWLGTPTAERPAFPDYDPTAWDERNPPPIDGTQETAPPAQDPPQGPPQGPPAGGQPPPTLPPDDAAREQFRATVKRLLGNRVAVEFDQSLGEGVAGEYVSRFGKDLEDTGKALGVVRENRRGELRALKARRTATDEDIADGKADPRTPEQIEESIRSLEAQEQAYLNDLAVRGTIRVASGMEAQAGLAEHESLHAAFEIFFGDNNASDRKAITTAFTQGVLARRLQNYFRDNPEVLAVIDPTNKDTFKAEEAAAYGFQVFLHDPGALQMGQKVEGIFNRLLQFLQGLVGYKTYEERARTIFNDLNSGKRAERGVSVLRDNPHIEKSMLSRSQDFVRGVGTGFMHMYDTVLSSTYSRMADSGNAAMAQIARLGYNATGETGQGMIQLQRQQTMQWSNRLKEALHALSVEELGQLNQAMLLNEELSGKLGQAQQRLRTVLTDVHRYQQEAGVDLGYIEDYYPMIWSPEKVSADYQGFIDMLQQYPEQLAEMNATADEVFERIASYEERGHEFQGIFGKDGEPVADSSRRRSLAFISPEDRLKYMEDNLVETMAHYLNQSVRHAEYVRAYGQNGARMRELLGEIRGVYGGSQDDVDLAKDYIDGLMENKEIGMSRELKDLYGAATVYQNVRLLPLSVFSSLVDPLGVAIRTDSAGAAFDTFTYSLRNLFTDFRKDWTPDMWEKYAADMGTIDMSGTVKSIDKIYTGVTLRGKTREINDGFFKWNLLNGWVKNNHIMATKAAQAYLRRSAEGMFGEERSAENLREAGVQPGDIVFDETLGRIRSTAPEILGYGNADEMEQRATEEEIAGARAQADRIQQAVHKIVRQSLIQPSSAELPGWLSNPYLAPIAHLKTFVFGFNATILNRLVYEAKRGNYNPIYYAAAYVPGMIAADFLKGLAGNGGEEPEWQKNWTAADYLAYGVNRSGLTGTGQFLVDMNNDVTRGGGGWESLAGPTIEQAKELMAAMNAKTSKPTETWMRNALPAHALYDQWLK